jgi:hypothetical protein
MSSSTPINQDPALVPLPPATASPAGPPAADVTRGLRVWREQLFLRLLLTTCRASMYTLSLESRLGTLRQS